MNSRRMMTHQVAPIRMVRQRQMIISAMLLYSMLRMIQPLPADEKVSSSELPRLTEMKLPTADELLRADAEDKEFDWVVLDAATEDQRQVVVVTPIFPRPNILEKQAEEYKKVEASRPRDAKEREARSNRLRSLQKLMFTLPGDLTEYAVPVERVSEVIFFEDLMLQVVDQLLQEGDFRTAWELLLRVETEIPQWEKSIPRFERLLLTEAADLAARGEPWAALARLDEVYERNPQSEELVTQISQIVGPMIDTAITTEEFGKAQLLIGRVRGRLPQHPLVLQKTQELSSRSLALIAQADQESAAGRLPQAAELAAAAERIWPTSGNSRASFTQHFSRHQVLRVGLCQFEKPGIFPAPQEYEERHRELMQVSLFEPFSADELTYFRSSFFEIWDPTDLGRQVLFTLRRTRPSWQSQPVLTANSIAEAISLRLDPNSPVFDSRLSSFVEEISVRSPQELRIRFSRVPLSVESLLRFPIVAEVQNTAAEGSAGTASELSLLSTRFERAETDEGTVSWLRTIPEPVGMSAGRYHIAEIQEHSFADRSDMIQAFVRGELDFLPHLLPQEVDAFKASDFSVHKYAIPLTHAIAFNPLSDRITNAQMRRALSFAINREGILRSTVLQSNAMKYGRTTSAAWNQQSYATLPTESAPRFNLRLAYALRFAAERQLQIAELMRLTEEAREKARKEKINFDSEQFRRTATVDYIKLPRLRFVVEPDPIAQAAAERIVKYWEKIGFEIDLIAGDREGEPLEDDQWDLCYRRLRMEEPLLELWSLIANDPNFDVARLAPFPDWMRQELIGLDYATSFVDAQEKLHRIHRHIAAQAFVIPLWEVDEFAAFRSNVAGVPEELMSVYHNAERWIIRP